MVNFVANNGKRMVEYEWETRGEILKAIASGQNIPDDNDSIESLYTESSDYGREDLTDIGIWDFSDLKEAIINEEI